MKTLNVHFIGGPWHGQSRDLAYPPVTFQHGPELDADDNPIGWPNVEPELGHYEEDSHSIPMGFAVFVWIPFVAIPDCLKPMDALNLAARFFQHEPRHFSKAWATGDKVEQAWEYLDESEKH